MTIIEYFNKVKNEIRNGNYIIVKLKNVNPPDKMSLHSESLNYMIYEWNEDRMDDRNDIFDYIVKPNNCDFQFTQITFEEFFKFLLLSKDENNEMIDLIVKKEIIEEKLDDFWLI